MVFKKVLYPGQIGIWDFDICEGRKTREPREKPLEQSKNQQQTRPTNGAKLEKPEPHLCTIPVPVDSLCSDWLYLFMVWYKQAYNHVEQAFSQDSNSGRTKCAIGPTQMGNL